MRGVAAATKPGLPEDLGFPPRIEEARQLTEMALCEPWTLRRAMDATRCL